MLKQNFTRYINLIASAGFGLGLGLAAVLGNAPQPVQSDTQLAAAIQTQQLIHTEAVRISQTEIPVISRSEQSIFSGTQAHFQPVFLGENLSYELLEGTAGLGNVLSELSLGDSVSLRRSNQGVYPFVVTEIKFVSIDQWRDSIAHVQAGVVLIAPTSWLSGEVVVVVGK